MIKNWLEMKKKEILLKNKLYGMILAFADEKEDLVKLVKDLYTELNDIPVNELRKEFISNLTEIIHAQAEKERETV